MLGLIRSRPELVVILAAVAHVRRIDIHVIAGPGLECSAAELASCRIGGFAPVALRRSCLYRVPLGLAFGLQANGRGINREN